MGGSGSCRRARSSGNGSGTSRAASRSFAAATSKSFVADARDSRNSAGGHATASSPWCTPPGTPNTTTRLSSLRSCAADCQRPGNSETVTLPHASDPLGTRQDGDHDLGGTAYMSETTTQAADALVIFGITGDLARKMTFPSLYRLEVAGRLACQIIGVAKD